MPTAAERVALEEASRYAGSSTAWTPENAPSYGLDPEKGFINPQFGVSAPAAPSLPPPSPPPKAMAPGLGTAAGAPTAAPEEGPASSAPAPPAPSAPIVATTPPPAPGGRPTPEQLSNLPSAQLAQIPGQLPPSATPSAAEEDQPLQEPGYVAPPDQVQAAGPPIPLAPTAPPPSPRQPLPIPYKAPSEQTSSDIDAYRNTLASTMSIEDIRKGVATGQIPNIDDGADAIQRIAQQQKAEQGGAVTDWTKALVRPEIRNFVSDIYGFSKGVTDWVYQPLKAGVQTGWKAATTGDWAQAWQDFKNTVQNVGGPVVGLVQTADKALGNISTDELRQRAQSNQALSPEQRAQALSNIDKIDQLTFDRQDLLMKGALSDQEQKQADDMDNQIQALVASTDPAYAKYHTAEAIQNLVQAGGLEDVNIRQGLNLLLSRINGAPMRYLGMPFGVPGVQGNYANMSPDQIKAMLEGDKKLGTAANAYVSGVGTKGSEADADLITQMLTGQPKATTPAELKANQMDPGSMVKSNAAILGMLPYLLQPELGAEDFITTKMLEAGSEVAASAAKVSNVLAGNHLTAKWASWLDPRNPWALLVEYPAIVHTLTHHPIESGIGVASLGVLKAMEYGGPIAAGILEKAAQNQYSGANIVQQALARSARSFAEGSTAAILPAALSSDNPQDFAKQLLNAGAVYTLLGAPRDTYNSILGAYMNPKVSAVNGFKPDPRVTRGQPNPIPNPIAYGTDPQWDSNTASHASGLNPEQQTHFAQVQQIMQPYAQVHLMLPAEQQAAKQAFNQPLFDSDGMSVFNDPRSNRMFVAINPQKFSLLSGHEAIGHPAFWLISDPAKRQGLVDQLKGSVDMEQVTRNYLQGTKYQGTTYDELPTVADLTSGTAQPHWTGLTKDYMDREMAADQFQAFWKGNSVAQWQGPPLTKKYISDRIGEVLEKLGLPSTTTEAQTVLGVAPSVTTSILMRGFFHDLAKGNVPNAPAEHITGVTPIKPREPITIPKPPTAIPAAVGAYPQGGGIWQSLPTVLQPPQQGATAAGAQAQQQPPGGAAQQQGGPQGGFTAPQGSFTEPAVTVRPEPLGPPPGWTAPPGTPQPPTRPATTTQQEATADTARIQQQISDTIHGQIRDLINQGKSPGEAQTIVAGKSPEQQQEWIQALVHGGMSQADAQAYIQAQVGGPAQKEPAHPEGVADFFRKRGDQPITSDSDSRLTTVNAGGQNWRVNKEAAPAFQGFLDELVSKGAPITLGGPGAGWAYRQKVGAQGLSEHSWGGAIDVNQLPGQRGKVTPEFRKWIATNPGVLEEAEKHWHIYGGERFGDLGHFEWGGVPIARASTAATEATEDEQTTIKNLDSNLGGLLQGKGATYVAMGKKYGVDPKLLAAISMFETTNGTSHVLRTRNNVGGITGAGHSGIGGDYMPYNSIEEGIEAEARLIKEHYINHGLDTIAKIGHEWAPVGGVANDPNNTNAQWPGAVQKFYAALGGKGKLGEPGDVPGDGESLVAKAGNHGDPNAREGGPGPVGGPAPSYPSILAGATTTPPAGTTFTELGPSAQAAHVEEPMPAAGYAGAEPQMAAAHYQAPYQAPATAEEAPARYAAAAPTAFAGSTAGGGGAGFGGGAAGGLGAGYMPMPSRGPEAGGFYQPGGPTPQQLYRPGFGRPPPGAPAPGQGFAQAKPAKVLSVRTVGAPPPAPTAPSAAQPPTPAPKPGVPAPTAPPTPAVPPGKPAPTPAAAGVPDPAAVKGLMKRGFTREQAEKFAAKATVSKPGAPFVQGASFKGGGLPPPPAPERVVKASTQGNPNVSTPALAEALAKAQTAKSFSAQKAANIDAQGAHAAALSPDDPRVKRQADNMFKGEHFVEGDPMHGHMLSDVPEHERAVLNKAQAAIADRRPMHITYASAPKKGLADVAPTTRSRQIEYEMSSPQARILGTTEAQLAGHSLIPTAIGISHAKSQGEPHEGYIQGVSTNTAANNWHHVNEGLRRLGIESPYKTLGPKFNNDLEGYISNLNAGYKGTGEGEQVGTKEYPVMVDPSHVPYKLSQNEVHFLNAVANNTAAKAKVATGLRELAERGGTLLTPEGETNPIRHAMDAIEPDWSRKTLEPTIRTFKAGLVHSTHERAQDIPEGIRPGREFEGLTEAIHRTSPFGRPDIPMSVAFMPARQKLERNRQVNQIERDYAEGRSEEPEASEQLKSIGENPAAYRFIEKHGLVSPHEPSAESLTPEEHAELTGNLRKQWIGGKLATKEYRARIAELPLPEIASRPGVRTPVESGEVRSEPSEGKPTAKAEVSAEEYQRLLRMRDLGISDYDIEKAKRGQLPMSGLPLAESGKLRPIPVRNVEAEAIPERLALPPEAPGPMSVAFMPGKTKAAKAAPEEPQERDFKDLSPQEKQAYVKQRIKDRGNIQGAVKLRPVRNDDGTLAHDEAGNPQYEKDSYDLVNSPILGPKRLDRARDQKFKDQEDIYSENEHTHLNPTDRRRLSYLEQKSAVDAMADKIADSYQNQMQHIPEVAAGAGWYSRMRDKLTKAFGPDAEIFAQLLGATSARTGVHQNFIQALDAYDQLKNGNFDRHIQKYLEAHDHLARGGGALGRHMLEQGMVNELPKTDAAAMAAWINAHNILPRQKNGAKYNANSNQVLKVLAQKWLQNVKAPKTPNFAGNLSGRTREATLDVWAGRFLHELGNEGNKKPWMLQPGGEGGVSGLDFAFGQRAFRKAADTLGVNPDDLQTIAWYHQKHLWEQRGHTKGQGAKKASFDETFDKIFKPSGERMTDEEARRAFAGEKDEPEVEEEEAAA